MGFSGLYPVYIEFYWVFIGIYWVLSSRTRFYRVLLDFILVLLGLTEIDLVLPSFTEFYLVSS